MTTTTFLRSAATLSVATILAACSGAGSAPPTAGSNALLGSQQSAPGLSFDSTCPKKNGIKVKPCMVTLSVSNPTANVTVKYPSGDDIKDSDKRCSKKNIATVAGEGADYVVTAGTSAGNCSVIFTVSSGGKTVGTATLKITNNV